MNELVLSLVVFVAGHLGLSAPPPRRWLVGMLGEKPFMAVHSAVSLALLVWVGWAYAGAPVIELWAAPTPVRHLSLSVMAVVCVLWVAAFTTPDPARTQAPPEGVYKVTRHPAVWGGALWAAVHVMANGDAASVVLFGAFLALSLAGAFALDARQRRALGARWAGIAAGTSNVPLLAVARGRARLRLADISWRAVLGGLALYAVLILLHGWLLGVSPLRV